MHARAQCSDIHHLLIGVEHTESEQSTPQLDLALPLTAGRDLGKFSNSEHVNKSF